MKQFGPIGASRDSMSPPVWLLPGPDPWKGVGYFFSVSYWVSWCENIFCVCVCACMFMGVLVCILGDPGGTLSKLPSSRVLDFSSAVSVRSSPKKTCAVSHVCVRIHHPQVFQLPVIFLFPRGNLPLAPPLSVGVLGMVSERVFHPLGSP